MLKKFSFDITGINYNFNFVIIFHNFTVKKNDPLAFVSISRT